MISTRPVCLPRLPRGTRVTSVSPRASKPRGTGTAGFEPACLLRIKTGDHPRQNRCRAVARRRHQCRFYPLSYVPWRSPDIDLEHRVISTCPAGLSRLLNKQLKQQLSLREDTLPGGRGIGSWMARARICTLHGRHTRSHRPLSFSRPQFRLNCVYLFRHRAC